MQSQAPIPLHPEQAPAPAPAQDDMLRARTQPRKNALEFKKSVADFIAILIRRKYVALGTVALITGLVTLIAFQITPRYTASAYVMIEPRQQHVLELDSVLTGMPTDAASIDSQVQLFRSRSLAAKVVERAGLMNDPEFNSSLRSGEGDFFSSLSPSALMESIVGTDDRPEAAAARAEREKNGVIDAYLGSLTVRRQGISYLIIVEFTSTDPQKAARIANVAADTYVVDQLDSKFEATRRASEWLKERLDQLSEQVRTAEQAVADYKASANLVDTTGGQTLNSQQLADLNTKLVEARAQVAEAKARMKQVDEMLAAGASLDSISEVVTSPLIGQLRQQEAVVKAKVAELATRYGDRHPLMVNARAELREIAAKIREEVNRIVQSMRNDVDVAISREKTIEENLNQLSGVAVGQSESQIRLRELQREAEANRTLYEAMLARFKETKAQGTLEQPDARVVSQAATPSSPSYPNKTFMVGAALAGSIFAAILLVLFLDKLDSGFRTAEEVEDALGLANLSLVPRVGTKGNGKAGPATRVMKAPMSSYAEALRGLQSSLLLASVDRPPKVVLFASALPGEGKSTMAMSFGRLNALSGKRTLVVDLDLRKPSIARLIDPADEKGRNVKAGVLEVLTGAAGLEHAIVRDASGLHILPAALGVKNPTDAIVSEQMRRLFGRLREVYDVVIIDSSPVLLVTDAKLATRLADATVLIVKWEETAREAAQQALQALASTGARVAGVVLSQVDMGRYQTYGYGAVPYYYYGAYRQYYGE